MESHPGEATQESERPPRPPRKKSIGVEDLFLPAVVAIMVAAVWYASRPEESDTTLALPDFSLPGIELPVRIELPQHFARVERGEAPRLQLGANAEGALREIRQRLLSSSERRSAEVETLPAVLPEIRHAAR